MNVHAAHAFCASLPGATLDYKWRFEDSVHPVFSVGGRMFAMFSMRSDALVDGVLFKADDARFLELTDREGIVPAPYLAKSKWVKLDRVARLADAEIRTLLVEAHAAIVAKLSKKRQAELLGAATAAAVAAAGTKTSARKRVATTATSLVKGGAAKATTPQATTPRAASKKSRIAQVTTSGASSSAPKATATARRASRQASR